MSGGGAGEGCAGAHLLVVVPEPVLNDLHERPQVGQHGAAHEDGHLLHDLDARVARLPRLLALAHRLEEGEQRGDAQRRGHHREGPCGRVAPTYSSTLSMSGRMAAVIVASPAACIGQKRETNKHKQRENNKCSTGAQALVPVKLGLSTPQKAAVNSAPSFALMSSLHCRTRVCLRQTPGAPDVPVSGQRGAPFGGIL